MSNEFPLIKRLGLSVHRAGLYECDGFVIDPVELERVLRESPVVYARKECPEHSDSMRWFSESVTQYPEATHTALLVGVQPIQKEQSAEDIVRTLAALLVGVQPIQKEQSAEDIVRTLANADAMTDMEGLIEMARVYTGQSQPSKPDTAESLLRELLELLEDEHKATGCIPLSWKSRIRDLLERKGEG